MPMTPEQLKEMQELEELDKLESELGGKHANLNPGLRPRPGQESTFDLARESGAGQAMNAAGEAMNPLLKVVGNAARRSRVLSQVKNPAGLAQNVKQQITEGLGQFNENAIKPAADKLREFLKGKNVQVSPGELRGGGSTLDKYAEMKAQALRREMSPVQAEQQAIDLPANVANELKRNAADTANYAKGKPFSESANAQKESAEKIAANLRQKVSNLGPEVDASNQSLQDMIQTRNRIRDLSDTAPIETVQGRLGSSKNSLVADVDKAAGTKLGELGKDISLAQKRLGAEPQAQGILPKSMEALVNKVIGYGPRAGGAMANVVDPVTQAMLKDPGYGGMLAQILSKRQE